jgi:hypothetical protein
MPQVIDAMVNVALARPALEKNRDGEELLALFDGAKQARRRDFSYVPLAVQIFVVPFAGTGKGWIDVQFIALDTDFAVDNRLAAMMVGKAEGDSGFGGHNKFPSSWQPIFVQIVQTVQPLRSVQAPSLHPPPRRGEGKEVGD